MTLHATAPSKDAADERRSADLRFVVVAVALAGSSGAAVMLQAFFDASMTLTVPFLVVPSGLLLVLVVARWQGRIEGADLVARRIVVGAAWGLIATVVYDIVRPPLGVYFGDAFIPYKAMPVFGDLITGRGEDDLLANVIGWGYHFVNGVGFGVMFALARPRGGRWLGLAWGLGLQVLMMITYPSLLGARLDDIGFLATGIFGHAMWGFVLGLGIERAWRSGTVLGGKPFR